MTTATRVLRQLARQIDGPRLATKRPVSRLDVVKALRAARDAKERVRVYSGMGFVPNSYRHQCRIQFIEGKRTEAGWEWRTGWCGAQRPYGSGALVVWR